MKVLALQHPSYFTELGVEFSGCEVLYGMPATSSAKRTLKKFDVVVSCLDHDISALKVIRLCNYIGVPTVYIADGIYDLTNASKNPAMVRIDRKQLFPASYGTIFCVGENFESWYRKIYPNVNVYSYFPERAKLSISENICNAKNSILFTTALRAYFDQEDFDSLVLESRRVLGILLAEGFEVTLRISDKRYLEALHEYKHLNFIDGTLSDAISKCSCVFSTTSTILFSCRQYGIPHVLINHRDDPVLYDVDSVILKGGEFDLEYIKSNVNVSQSIPELDCGLVFANYSYDFVHGLEADSKDFSYFGFFYMVRSAYRLLPQRYKTLLKRMVA